MNEHTPTPWEDLSDVIETSVEYGGEPDECATISVSDEDRKFILLACNNHDRLIKALEYCAAGPGELQPANQAQYLVARKALDEVRS